MNYERFIRDNIYIMAKQNDLPESVCRHISKFCYEQYAEDREGFKGTKVFDGAKKMIKDTKTALAME